MGDKLGPVLFQTPPWLKCDLPVLRDFLALIPSGVRAAFEFRNSTWFDDRVYTALAESNAALAVADTGDELRDPPLVRTADWGYARLRRSEYRGELLKQWADGLSDMSWDYLWVFFKHDDGGAGPASRHSSCIDAGMSGQLGSRRQDDGAHESGARLIPAYCPSQTWRGTNRTGQ